MASICIEKCLDNSNSSCDHSDVITSPSITQTDFLSLSLSLSLSFFLSQQVKQSRLRQKSRQKSRIIATKTLNSGRLNNNVNVWTGEGKLSPSGRYLQAPEDKFLEDMLSDQPRFQSNSQVKPMKYWEKAAATIPEYRGPWQPVVETMPPMNFEFYS